MVDINYLNRSVDLKMTVIFIFGFLEISGSFFSLLSIIIFPLAILGSEYLLFVNKAMMVFFVLELYLKDGLFNQILKMIYELNEYFSLL